MNHHRHQTGFIQHFSRHPKPFTLNPMQVNHQNHQNLDWRMLLLLNTLLSSSLLLRPAQYCEFAVCTSSLWQPIDFSFSIFTPRKKNGIAVGLAGSRWWQCLGSGGSFAASDLCFLGLAQWRMVKTAWFGDLFILRTWSRTTAVSKPSRTRRRGKARAASTHWATNG